MWKIIGVAGKIQVQGMAENLLCLYIPWYQDSQPENLLTQFTFSLSHSSFHYFVTVMKSETSLVILTNLTNFT